MMFSPHLQRHAFLYSLKYGVSEARAKNVVKLPFKCTRKRFLQKYLAFTKKKSKEKAVISIIWG